MKIMSEQWFWHQIVSQRYISMNARLVVKYSYFILMHYAVHIGPKIMHSFIFNGIFNYVRVNSNYID